MTATSDGPFYVKKGHVHAVPVIHYTMETAAQVVLAFKAIQPDCVAVELPETIEKLFLQAASRLPETSVISCFTENNDHLYYPCEPCDGIFEGLRSALEKGVKAFCIDLDVDNYPLHFDHLPDPYAITKIGLQNYYRLYAQAQKKTNAPKDRFDQLRELYMAKRLKELSFSYERILFVTGFHHLENVLKLIDNPSFPPLEHAKKEHVQLFTLSEKSSRDCMAECGWITRQYDSARSDYLQKSAVEHFPPDRSRLIYSLYKQSAEKYTANTGNFFAGYNMRNLMKFMRNYAFVKDRLVGDLFQILSCARSCVDHNYAYETWELATEYPHRKNIDSLPELEIGIDELWGNSKKIKFHLKQPSRKNISFKKRPDKSQLKFHPPGAFGLCSYPPEDLKIEKFGDFLKKKGVQILTEEAARTQPFVSSVEDGIDTRETIHHWHEKKLYVKVKGKPPGSVSSLVVIFDEDFCEHKDLPRDKYPWRLTWLGEHSQESDMAFYATALNANVVGPGISRCEYGGFMLSSPPRRMLDIWSDPDYHQCRSKAEVLLVAAIDYAVSPLVVYVAAKPPRSMIKSFAARYGKKIIYIPITQLSSVLLNKIRVFHVLDGFDKRDIAGEYIY